MHHVHASVHTFDLILQTVLFVCGSSRQHPDDMNMTQTDSMTRLPVSVDWHWPQLLPLPSSPHSQSTSLVEKSIVPLGSLCTPLQYYTEQTKTNAKCYYGNLRLLWKSRWSDIWRSQWGTTVLYQYAYDWNVGVWYCMCDVNNYIGVIDNFCIIIVINIDKYV